MISNYGHLTLAQAEEKLDEADEEIERLKTKFDTMWGAELTMHQANCFINNRVEALEDLSEYWLGLGARRSSLFG